MDYIEIEITLSKNSKNFEADLLKNDLGNIGFESFVDIDNYTFKAYCPENGFDSQKFTALLHSDYLTDQNDIKYKAITIKDQNWNASWEKDCPEVCFGSFCHIGKKKSETSKFCYDIIIDPKQSFGTANHPTTWLIISYLSNLKDRIYGKNIIDMGCGTAVLAILTKKMGAKYVQAIDIDTWAYRNSVQNALANKVDIDICLGSTEKINNTKMFDLFIANINLNIILQNLESYSSFIKKDGLLIMSGFFVEDTKELIDEAQQHNLEFYYTHSKDNWSILVLKKY